ncbi:MAG TPA: phage Gp37/Gp68 family protein [Microbacterium sp.]|nr:phage Gp37/Gp68 family protein [Microbacterium sp.]
MGKTEISWTDVTWNPVRGCSQVSPGCANCYAKHQAARIVRMSKGKPSKYDRLVRITKSGEPAWTGEVELDPVALAAPLSWKKPRQIFVNSMSDLFHEKLTNEQIAAVFGVMAAAPQHTFQVLTKRARRMREWFEWANPVGKELLNRIPMPPIPRALIEDAALDALNGVVDGIPRRRDARWPLPNVHLGVSAENQDTLDERWPDLLACPAVVRWFSCEPLLGDIDLKHMLADAACKAGSLWLVAGCESGPGARPCDVAWLRSLRDQCAAAGVPFFLKQAVSTNPYVFRDQFSSGTSPDS